jgi:putative hydrolase of the HAD superfamily
VTTTAVLFDLDDTLFDHWSCTREALSVLRTRYAAFGGMPQAALEATHGTLLEELHLDVMAGRLTVDDARIQRFRRLFEHAGAAVDDGMARAAAGAYREAYVAHWRPVAGALSLLASVRGRASIGIVTNNVASEQHQKLDACGFRPYLDAVVISEEAGVAKPDPRIFEIAIGRLGRPLEETVMIGDAWATDVTGARSAGLRAIWFNRFGAASPDPSVSEIGSLAPAASVLAAIFPNHEHSHRSPGCPGSSDPESPKANMACGHPAAEAAGLRPNQCRTSAEPRIPLVRRSLARRYQAKAGTPSPGSS